MVHPGQYGSNMFITGLLLALIVLHSKGNQTENSAEIDDPKTQFTYYTINRTCPLNNFTTSAFLNDFTPNIPAQITLNMSWDNFLEECTDINVKIFPNEENAAMDPKVSPFFLDAHVNNCNNSVKNIVQPPLNMSYLEQLMPGLSYDIILIPVLDGDEYECRMNYTVPECVGNMESTRTCDCTKYEPRAKIVNIFPGPNDFFHVQWSPENPNNRNDYMEIKSINFFYKMNNQDGYFMSDYTPVDSVENDIPGNQSTVEIKKISRGEEYIMYAIFVNKLNCASQNVAYAFTVPRDNTNIITCFLVAVGIVLIIILKYQTIAKLFKKIIPTRRIPPMPKPGEITRISHGEANELRPLKDSLGIPMSENTSYIPAEFEGEEVDRYEIPYSRIEQREEINSGEFGEVFSAKLHGAFGRPSKMVAVKRIKDPCSADDIKEFRTEIEIFKKIGYHPNIVELIGCCTLKPPYMIVMELVPCGNLREYLVELRKTFYEKIEYGQYIEPNTPSSTSGYSSNTETVISIYCEEEPVTPRLRDFKLFRLLDHKELQNFGHQIAKGMAHMEKIPITHRDLAARNILINESRQLKISDFGMSRHGPYVNTKSCKMPVRWMPMESIWQHVYDSKSDVWSFGVVLWEIATLGAVPYGDVEDTRLIPHFIEQGNRLFRPEMCTEETYNIMRRCWESDPHQRPSFRELVDLLDENKSKLYVDFNQLNPTYVFPPSDIDRFDVADVVRIRDGS